ncbi:MAG: PAQR family membrane homeostasis protein TrhA [Myxococcota bacterium]
MKPADLRGLYEEIANSVSHAVGLGLAAAGWSALLVRSIDSGDPWRMVAALVFGTCMLSMYVSSVLYHGYQIQPLKHMFRVCDHITIYFVISGTFTPFLLVFDRSAYGWTMLGVIWGMTFMGVIYKLFFFGRPERESVGTYAIMTIVAFIAAIPVVEHVGTPCLAWLAGGLVCYMIGVYFYLNDQKPFYHTVWHFWVIGGSTCHYIGIWVYLVGPAPL